MTFKKDLKNIIILDVKTTCWEYRTPIGQQNEIIKLGVTVLNITDELRVCKETFTIKPNSSEITPFCSKVTGVYPQDLEDAIPFQEVCAILENKYDSKFRVWATYGSYERTIFQKQSRTEQIRYPFSNNHINIKNMLSLILKLNSEIKLEKAFELLGIVSEKIDFNNESWSAAMILGCLMQYDKFINMI